MGRRFPRPLRPGSGLAAHTDRMEPQPDSLAEYAEMTGSPVKDEVQQRHLGMPPHLPSASLLSWDGIAEATPAVRLSVGGTVDLACGRGGSGLVIAARTEARLVGIDFSAEAVRQAREARRLGCRGGLPRPGIWLRPGWAPGRRAPCGAWMRSTSPRSQAPTARSGGPRVWRGRRSEFGVPFVGGGSPGPGGNVHSGPGRQCGWVG